MKRGTSVSSNYKITRGYMQIYIHIAKEEKEKTNPNKLIITVDKPN